ncbi:hypothetical protein LCGC14_1991820 [marine sediment metagenome]|uniref:Uncharacterized protein n=1 Tax=marine sediment metagenome TaxID=412755 RepID=A0A0F9HJ85_9ZZZZ
MGGRDHSVECDTCGEWRGGFNDMKCLCSEHLSASSDTFAGLREPVGDVPDDGAIAEIVAALDRGEDEVGL